MKILMVFATQFDASPDSDFLIKILCVLREKWGRVWGRGWERCKKTEVNHLCRLDNLIHCPIKYSKVMRTWGFLRRKVIEQS